MRYFILILLTFAPLLLGACEDTVDPILKSDRQFTLWGALDMNADVQYLRIIPIRPTLDRSSRDELDVDVQSVHVETGDVVQWRDSVVTFPDGNIGHVFSAPFRIRPNHSYRIEVRSPDSEIVTTATTTIPPLPTAEVFPEIVTSALSPIGENIVGSQKVVWHDVSGQPYLIEQWYRFLELGYLNFVDIKMPYVTFNRYSEAQRTLSFSLDLKRDRDSLDTKLGLDQVRLVGLGMTITVLDDGFVPPGGVFDPDVLVQPGTLSNVTNGFGLIGSIGRFSIEWTLDDKSAVTLHYIPLRGASVPAPPGPGKRTARLSSNPWTE